MRDQYKSAMAAWQTRRQLGQFVGENLGFSAPAYLQPHVLGVFQLVVHGDDWRSGVQEGVRGRVVGVLASYGGSLVEVRYTEGVSSSFLKGET